MDDISRTDINLKRATLYTGISKYITMIVQIILSMILARLIEAEEYGILSILTVILNFLTLIADMGFGITIIQHPEMEWEEQNELFSFTAVFGVILMLIMVFLAYPMSLVYKEPQYLIMCPLLSVAAITNALNIVPNAILTRERKFDLIAVRTIVCTVLPGLLAVIMAFYGAKAYSLLFQSIFASLLIFLWNYTKSPLKLVRFSVSKIRKVLGKYSLYQFVFNLLNYFTRNLDSLVIGATFGGEALGYYNKAYTLNLYPNSIFTNVITSVLHPYIRELKNDMEKLNQKIIEILKVLSLLGLLVTILCFSCAEEIVFIMFGDGWEVAGYCFKMLSICIWAQMISSVAGSVFLGIERTDQTLKLGIINIGIILIAIICGVFSKKIYIFAFVIGVAYNIMFLITYYVLIKLTIKSEFLKFLKSFIPEMIGIVLFIILSSNMNFIFNSIWKSFCLKLIMCCVYYIIFLLVTGQLSKSFILLKRFIK